MNTIKATIINYNLCNLFSVKNALDNGIPESIALNRSGTLLTESLEGSDFKLQIQRRELSELDFSPGSVFYAHWDPSDAHILIDVP